MKQELNFNLKYYRLKFFLKEHSKKIKAGLILLLISLTAIWLGVFYLKYININLNKEYKQELGSKVFTKSEADYKWLMNNIANEEYDNTHRIILKIASIDRQDIYWERIAFSKNQIQISGRAKTQGDLQKYIDKIKAHIKEVQWSESQRMDKKSREIYFSLTGIFKKKLPSD